MFKLAVVLAALVSGSSDNDGGVHLPDLHDPNINTTQPMWRVVKVLDDNRILVEVFCSLRWCDMRTGREGSAIYPIPFNGYSNQLILLSGIPADLMRSQSWDWNLHKLQFDPVGNSNVAKGAGQTFVLEFSHTKFLERKAKWDASEAAKRANMLAMENRKVVDAALAKQEKLCEVEFAAIDKTIKALATSVANIGKGDEFARKQARLGVDRNIAKLEKSLAALMTNGCPTATLDEIKAKVGKAIASAKAAAK